ncbi:transmembrane protein [Cystoisospora suis]|uniref:ER membrane protein complex subunit 1 n=1 Tax=Cystoisospora suis TaxID=483139 RepID=A0A2C6LH14_9APIC|nr:transmembrane protein [Cystoisospora suis]
MHCLNMATRKSNGEVSGAFPLLGGKPCHYGRQPSIGIKPASLRPLRVRGKRRHFLSNVFLNVLAFCFALSFLQSSVTGVQFEDEAGFNDWLSEQVGHVLHLLPKETSGSSHTSVAEDGSFVVGTSHGVIAAFNEKHGTPIWRRVNEENDRIERLERHGPFIVAAIRSTLHQQASVQSRVCVYLEADGSLRWIAEHGALDFAVSGYGAQEAPLIAVSYAAGIEVRRLEDGELVWTAGRGAVDASAKSAHSAFNDVTSVVGLWPIARSDKQEMLAILYVHSESGVVGVRALDFRSGAKMEDVSLDIGSQEEVEVVRGSPECTGILSESSGTSLTLRAVLPAPSDGASLLLVSSTFLVGPGDNERRSFWPAVGSATVKGLPVNGCAFAVSGDVLPKTLVLRAVESGSWGKGQPQLREVFALPGHWALGRLLGEAEVVSSLWTELGGEGSAALLGQLPCEPQKRDAQKLAQVVAKEGVAVPRKSSELVFGRLLLPSEAGRRMILVTSDAVVSLLTAESWVWSREESLADVRGVVMYTMPYTPRQSLEQRDLTSIPFLGGFLPDDIERYTLEGALVSGSPPTSSEGWSEDLKRHVKRTLISLLLKTLQLVEFTVALGREAVHGVRRAAERRPSSSYALWESAGTVQRKGLGNAPFGFAWLSAAAKLRLLGFSNVSLNSNEETVDLAATDGRPSTGSHVEASMSRKTPVVRPDSRLFGWTELIIAATCSDHVYALHAATGLIVWQQNLDFWGDSTASRKASYARCRAAGALDTSPLVGVAATNGRKFSVLHAGPATSKAERKVAETSSGVVGLHLVGHHKKELLAVVADTERKITRLVWMDATLGTILYTGQVPFIPLHLLPLQAVNPYHHHSAASPAEEKPQRIFEESNAVFLVAAQGGGRAFMMVPEKTEKTVELTSKMECSLARHLSRHLSLYSLELGQQQLVGFLVRAEAVGGGSSSKSESKCTLATQKSWSLPYGQSGQMIAAAARPLHSDYPHVPVLVTGNISIVYKYINPNLMAVITQPQHKGDVESGLGGSLTLSLINLTDGAVVYAELLPPGASLPLHLVVYDNVVLTHYWNLQHTRFEVHIVELQDAQKDQGPWSIIFSAARHIVPTLTGFGLPPPTFLAQTYIIPTGVRALGVSATQHGITTLWTYRHAGGMLEVRSADGILLKFSEALHCGALGHEFARQSPRALFKVMRSAVRELENAWLSCECAAACAPRNVRFQATTGSHQVYALSTRLANARRPQILDGFGRPLKTPIPTQHQEDGVLPYHPVLPLNSHDCLSYYHQVFHVRGIAAHHTSRESTSSTFFFGLDLFFSPVQPAKGYDVLSTQFNYGLLAAAMITLTGLTFLTHWRAKDAELAAKWR